MRPSTRASWPLAILLITTTFGPLARSDDRDWLDLSDLGAWKSPIEGWATAASVALDPGDPKKLSAQPGSGLLQNATAGRAKNLVSKEEFGDVEVHLEFFLPKGSNSGIKFQSVYEIQLFDSFGSTRKPSGGDSGGIYPRSEEKPKYHHIDDGYAPLVNASKPPGEWQVLDATFLAPRFDASGKKVANARITATLNGKLVQDRREVPTPTGNAWHDPEKPTGPLLIQADHGPIALRNLKARRLTPSP